jgi:hypothetical protein
LAMPATVRSPSTTQDLFLRQNKLSVARSPRSTIEVRTAWDKLKAIFSKNPKGKEMSFPPPTWFEDGHVVNPGASEAAANPASSIPDGKGNNPPSESDGSDPPPPALLIAQKIQELTLHLPSNASLVDAKSHPPVDPKLAKLLGTEYIMNGSLSKGRKSVWAALEKLSPSPHEQQPPESGDEIDAIGGTMMLCSPILPSSEDVAELASSHEVIPMDASVIGTEVRAYNWPWPFGKWSKKTSATPTAQPSKVQVWEPSLTKLSVHVMWWGYRLSVEFSLLSSMIVNVLSYLPPPVMAVIGNEYTEVSQRAAIITTALTWLIGTYAAKNCFGLFMFMSSCQTTSQSAFFHRRLRLQFLHYRH